MVTTADQNLVRKFNTAVVLNILRSQAPCSRAEVAANSGLNRSTVSSIVAELLGRGLVQETILQSDRVGRPGMLLELNPGGGFALGIELGVDFILVALADLLGQIRWRVRVDTDPAEGQAALLERLYELTALALAESARQGRPALGIGLGVPGLVDLERGELILAPNLGWGDTPLRRLLAERFGLPVYVENEAKAAALGEFYFGQGRGHPDFLYLNSGVGMGAGIMIDGKLFRGSRGFAAEVGHMLVDPDGELCGCGKRGCWETRVGPRAVVHRFAELLRQQPPPPGLPAVPPGRVTFERVAELARQAHPAACQALAQVAEDLGLGIASLVNIFNPSLVVLGGALAGAADLLLPLVEASVRAHAMRPQCEGLQIAASAHPADGCVVGAAALVVDNILN